MSRERKSVKLGKRILCMEWDRRALRLVSARLGGREIALEDAHSHRVPAGIDVDDPKAMGEFISQTLRRHRLRQRRVLVCIAREKAVINRLTVPPTPAHELPTAVRFQAMKELPFPLDEAVIDYAVMSRNERGMAIEVLLAAARKETVQRIAETCTAAGLEVARIGLRPHANLVSVSQLRALRDQRVLFVDIGPTMTEIDVMRGGLLLFSRSASVSVPRRPDEYVSEDSRVSSKSDQAQLMLVEDEETAAVEELLVETTRTLQAYRATEPNSAIEQIVIAGGTGLETDLLEAVEERFGLPAILFDPTDLLRVAPTEAVKLRSFAAPLGLAWGLDRDGAIEIDFWNPKRPVPPRADLQRRLRMAGIAAAVVLVCGGVGARVYYGKRQAHLDGLRADIAQLEEELRKQRRIQNAVDEVAEWKVIADESVLLDHLLTISRHMVEPGKRSLARNVSMDARQGSLTLDLLADDWSVVNTFVENLNQVREAGGEPIYRATAGPWREGTNEVDTSFKGTATVSVEVVPIRKHLDTAKDRERKRKQRLDLSAAGGAGWIGARV